MHSKHSCGSVVMFAVICRLDSSMAGRNDSSVVDQDGEEVIVDDVEMVAMYGQRWRSESR